MKILRVEDIDAIPSDVLQKLLKFLEEQGIKYEIWDLNELTFL